MDLDVSVRLMLMENDIYLEISAVQYSVDWVLYVIIMIVLYSAANKYYSSAGHHEQKNQRTYGQIKFSVVTIK